VNLHSGAKLPGMLVKRRLEHDRPEERARKSAPVQRFRKSFRDGPWGADQLERTRWGRRLIAIEAAYYKKILLPDLLIVLLVDPEVAVRRKTDEPADYVRQRGELVWSVDWSATGARIVDAGQPLADVVADLKAILWQEL